MSSRMYIAGGACRGSGGDVATAEDEPGGNQWRNGVEERDPDGVPDQTPVGRAHERCVPGVQLRDEDVGACALDRRQRGQSLEGERVEDRADDARDALPSEYREQDAEAGDRDR